MKQANKHKSGATSRFGTLGAGFRAWFLAACGLQLSVCAAAQGVLSLDSCRAMALRNNKQLSIAQLKQDIARDVRKAARTKYLPHIDVMGGYEFTSKEISILNDEQKGALGGLGTTAAGNIGNTMSSVISELAGQGVITQQTANSLGNIANKLSPSIEQAGNAMGKTISDAFRTDTRNMLIKPISSLS